MKKCWRWFGKKDPITLDMLRQIGVEGIVTALHDVPNGQVWPTDIIREVKRYIASYGLHWSVVESLPVVESIKYRGKDRDRWIDNYNASLKHLGQAGITTVCYNFMPVIDWVRTDLHKILPDGTQTLYFDKIKFAYFDCKILKRKDAEKEYTPEEMDKVNALDRVITEKEKNELIDTIIVKTQGFINRSIVNGDEDPVEAFRKLLDLYENVDETKLRENLKYFLQAVIPVAEKYGVRMCIHPDDPPFPVFGLPRIVSDKDDIRWILDAVESPSNGFTFCAGSLSAGIQNDVADLARNFAKQSFFVHLRSTEIAGNGDFIEASHLGGRANLIEVIRIFEKENPAVPMRVDHGKLMLNDIEKAYNPGYSFLGRMVALAQIEGMMAVVRNEIETGIY
ncbi:mannonate dehydratase [Anaerorudis cellulosivorans]|uniref:mannonate dehydratase n=1 Tax=Anaerorudis cellulosivorans TaxID=3397862 RepID=UPI00221FC4AD|nr:mannonate dehydratase [Seramator thermalis]MCW1734908.1 mannonate dehydratase [Seramator thermalis]